VSFVNDEGAFGPERGKRKWRRTTIGVPWNAQSAINSFVKGGFDRIEAEQLVLDQHVRSNSPLGKSLKTHRTNLIKDYISQGMSKEEAVAYIREYLEAIKEERNYGASFDAVMAEVITYHKRFVESPVDRRIGESVTSAVERWVEAREKVGTWRERNDKLKRAYKAWKIQQERNE
jgi:hypothetical protein